MERSMSNNLLSLKVFTPHGTSLECEAEMVLLPGKEGEFGVLYGHENMIAAVMPGMLKVYVGRKLLHSISIQNGVVEIGSTFCHVMVNDAARPSRVDIAHLQGKLGH
jgi:F-type H+-transporting ATPase subunit epsilon